MSERTEHTFASLLDEDRAEHAVRGRDQEHARLVPVMRTAADALRRAGEWDALDLLSAELPDDGMTCGCCLGTGKYSGSIACKCRVGQRRFPYQIASGK